MVSLREYGKYLLTAFLYYLAAFLLLFVFLYVNNKTQIFTNSSFLNWDAQHYFSIKNEGYDHGLTAFFPLFPYLWKVVSLSPMAIGFFNFGLFLAAVSLLCAEMRLKLLHTLILLSVPGLFFMFLPYAEALFFLCGTLVIVGLKNEKMWLALLGLFLCSLCRPTTFIFIPAIIIVHFFFRADHANSGPDRPSGGTDWKSFFLKSVVFSVVLLCGLMLSFAIQKAYTGQWFAFFESQERNWGNKLRLPTLPLRTWGGDNITRYEASAFFIGIACAVFIVVLFFNKRWAEKLKAPKHVLFSIAYLAGATGIVLLFRGGLLFSLNRFIYATPFLLVALGYFLSGFSFSLKQVALFFFGTTVFWLLFNSYTHIHNFLCFSVVSLILSAVLLATHKNRYISMASSIALISVNNIVAWHLISKFLNGMWVA